MRVTFLVVATASLFLSSCAMFARSSNPGLSAPPLVCPSSLTARIEDEPLAPKGFSIDTLPPQLAQWWFGDYIPWSRSIAVRLDQGKSWCEKKAASK